MPQPKGKDEASCPMCGSPLAKSPAGATMLRMMAEMGKRGQQGDMNKGGGPRGPMQQGMPMRRPGMGGR